MKTFSSKFFISGVLAAMLLAPSFAFAQEATTASGVKVETAAPATFTDVARTSPYYIPITFLNQSGVLGGYADNTFKPDNTVNRAEVLKVIFKGSGVAVDAAQTDAGFSDVKKGDWFAAYVAKAKSSGITGGNPDGSFAPGRPVTKAEFLKMLLLANQVKPEALKGKEANAPDVAKDAWYATYVGYAASLGIIVPDAQGKLFPEKPLTRGEVAEMMYLMTVIRKGSDTQFLLTRAEAELAQIEVFITANRVDLAKKSSDLAVDFTQQAYKNLPSNNVVVGAAKVAKAYNLLVNSFILGIQKKNPEAADMANQAIKKASEAYSANNATQPIAKHIKDRAREILTQVGGKEQ